MKNNTLIIRADATTRMGTGHIMRCLALSQAWQDQMGEVTFVCAQLPEALKHRLHAERMSVEPLTVEPGTPSDARELIQLSERHKASWVVVDGYQFNAAYQRHLKDAGLKVLFVDDFGHASPYSADLVLNQNFTADESLYVQRAPWTRLLLGAQYVMLRREFTEQTQSTKTIVPIARKILITMGGSDPDNVTGKVLCCFKNLSDDSLELVLVIGAGNPHRQTLQQIASELPLPVRIEQNVTDMPSLMAWADMAITAAGSTCYELAYMGVPAIVIILADNQQAVARGLDQTDIVQSLGWHHRLDADRIGQQMISLAADAPRRSAMTSAGQETIDGQGSLRLLQHMGARTIRLRLAHSEDCRQLWEWRHDPVTLASAFNSEPIAYEQHVRWFNQKMQQADCLILIAFNDQVENIGQVRFDLTADRALIDVTVAPNMRGKRIGRQMIRMASRQILRQSCVRVIDAFVMIQNVASCHAFEQAGYTEVGRQEMFNVPVIHYEYTC